MAKAKPRAEPKPSENGAAGTVLEVSYGNLNVGEKVARLACHMSRKLSPGSVDKLLVGRRLTVECLARSAGGSGQDSIPGMDNDIVVKGVADSKSVGLGVKSYTFGLTFSIEDIEIEELARFAKRFGTVTIQNIADIPESEGGEDE